MPLFARHGFAGTTTKQIARAAGVSEALVFQHFPSKAALYEEILRLRLRGRSGPGAPRRARAVDRDAGRDGASAAPPRRAGRLRRCGRGRGRRAPRAAQLARGRRVCAAGVRLDRGARSCPSSRPASRRRPPPATCARAAAMPRNAFWFAYHVAAMIAFGRLSGRPAYPYAGPLEAVLLRPRPLRPARHRPQGSGDRGPSRPCRLQPPARSRPCRRMTEDTMATSTYEDARAPPAGPDASRPGGGSCLVRDRGAPAGPGRRRDLRLRPLPRQGHRRLLREPGAAADAGRGRCRPSSGRCRAISTASARWPPCTR